mmetsp:Transcript_15244/g.65273  ORF Transcript_15244/g.65273 Transcript_15244/m.65273 type:complete len:440 (-) Transcript_15244:811-2130(-)
MAAEPTTMCFTGPCSSTRGASMLMSSPVGATGLCTHRPPPSSLITVMRTFTSTSSKPCSWSNVQTSPGTTVAIAVALLPYGASGSAHQYGYHRSGCAALVALAQNASCMEITSGYGKGSPAASAARSRDQGSAPAANAAAVPRKPRREASGARFCAAGRASSSAAWHRIDFRAETSPRRVSAPRRPGLSPAGVTRAATDAPRAMVAIVVGCAPRKVACRCRRRSNCRNATLRRRFHRTRERTPGGMRERAFSGALSVSTSRENARSRRRARRLTRHDFPRGVALRGVRARGGLRRRRASEPARGPPLARLAPAGAVPEIASSREPRGLDGGGCRVPVRAHVARGDAPRDARQRRVLALKADHPRRPVPPAVGRRGHRCRGAPGRPRGRDHHRLGAHADRRRGRAASRRVSVPGPPRGLERDSVVRAPRRGGCGAERRAG